jgi:hypothetical protein
VGFIQKDYGGVLRFDLGFLKPSLWDSSPTPTVTLYDPTGLSEMLAEQDTTPGPSTTVGAGGAEAEQSTVPITDPTGMVVGTREEYVIGPSAALGQWEVVELRGVASGDVRLRYPLQYSYAAGDPFRSTRLSVLIEGSEAGTVYENAQARWKYYADSRPYTKTSLFSVSLWAPDIPVTALPILRQYPQARNEMADVQDLEDLLSELWDQLLDRLAMKAGHASRLVSSQGLRQSLILMLLEHLPFVNREEDQLNLVRERLNEEWSQVCQLLVVDTDGDGAIEDDDQLLPATVGRFYRG